MTPPKYGRGANGANECTEWPSREANDKDVQTYDVARGLAADAGSWAVAFGMERSAPWSSRK